MDSLDNDFDGVSSQSPTFLKMLYYLNIVNILMGQQKILSHLEKMNAMLQTLNELSTLRLSSLATDLRLYTRRLISLKRELNMTNKRIESVKKTVRRQFPSEYEEASGVAERDWRAELNAEVAISSPLPRTFTPSMGPLAE